MFASMLKVVEIGLGPSRRFTGSSGGHPLSSTQWLQKSLSCCSRT